MNSGSASSPGHHIITTTSIQSAVGTTGSASSPGMGSSSGLDSDSSEDSEIFMESSPSRGGGTSCSSPDRNPEALPASVSESARKLILPNAWIDKSHKVDIGEREFQAILECIESDGGWSKCLGFRKKTAYLNNLNSRLHSVQGKLNE